MKNNNKKSLFELIYAYRTAACFIFVLIVSFMIAAVQGRIVKLGYNRSDASYKSTSLASGKIIFSDGTEEDILPHSLLGYDRSKLLMEIVKNPDKYVKNSKKLKSSLSQTIIVPKKGKSEPIVKVLDGKNKKIKRKKINDTEIIVAEKTAPEELLDIKNSADVERIYRDSVVFTSSTNNVKVAQSSANTKTTTTSPTGKGVTIGIVDTGVDGVTFGGNYAPGFEGGFSYMQPWQSKRSFPVTVPASGGWLNVLITWNNRGADITADLDLVLKDASGKVLASSARTGSVPPYERIEYFVKSSTRAPVLTAEVIAKPNTPRFEYHYSGTMDVNLLMPSTFFDISASLNPKRIDIKFTGETTNTPRGAQASLTGKWKLGSFNLFGKNYNIAVSDSREYSVCGYYDDESSNYHFRNYIDFGYDTIAIDTNGDGNYSEMTLNDSCEELPGVFLEGQLFSYSNTYSSRSETWGIINGRQFEDDALNLSSFNSEVTSIFSAPSQYYSPVSTLDDFIGHGTHVAGIAKQMAPESRIYNAKAFGNSNAILSMCYTDPQFVSCENIDFAWESDVISAIEGAVVSGAKVVNLSLGFPYDFITSKCQDYYLTAYVKDLIYRKNITVVAAAGNSGPYRAIHVPACLEEVITVGSVALDGKTVPNYSSRGPSFEGVSKPDLLAIGGGDPAAYVENKVLFNFANGVSSTESSRSRSHFGILTKNNTSIKMSGTSMAAPQVSGAAALLLSRHPGLTPSQVKQVLMNSTDNLGLPYGEQGAGVLNMNKLIKKINSSNPMQ